MKKWYYETLHPDFVVGMSASEVLHESGEGDHHLVVFKNKVFEEVLMYGGAYQLTGSDNKIYHEMMADVPIIAHGSVEDVLIIGGGDGGMARHVLMHENVSVTQVEISEDIVNFSKEFLPAVSDGAYDNDRHTLIIADGQEFVSSEEARKKFDVIITDLTDPIGDAKDLFEFPFYKNCKQCLKQDGILVTQNGVPFVQPDELQNSMEAFGRLFKDTWCYTATIPTYVGGEMAFGWGTDNLEARNTPLTVLQDRVAKSGITETMYYTPEMHEKSFVLPPYIEKLVTGTSI